MNRKFNNTLKLFFMTATASLVLSILVYNTHNFCAIYFHQPQEPLALNSVIKSMKGGFKDEEI